MSAAGKFFAVALAIAIPVGVVYLVTSRGKKTGPTPNPATPVGTESVDGTIVKLPLDPKAKLVGWFQYFGLWIRVEEFTDSIDTDTDSPHVKTASYKARFRWTVFTSGKEVPLGVGHCRFSLSRSSRTARLIWKGTLVSSLSANRISKGRYFLLTLTA